MLLKLFSLFGAFYLSAKAQDTGAVAEVSGLMGVGYHITDSKSGLPYLSMAGGAPITIHGNAIADNIDSNFILFKPNWVDGVQLFGPVLSENDEFNAGNFHSNAIGGRLAYLTPAVTDLLHATWEQFNSQIYPNSITNELSFQLDVWNADDDWTVVCQTASNCKLRYHRQWTPYLYSVTPANVVRDEWMQFNINPNRVHQSTGTPADAWPWRELRLGESLVDWEPTTAQGDRLAANQIGHITVVVTDMTPNNNLKPNLMFHNGYQHDMPSLETCTFAGDDCWKVRVHPKIDSVSESEGYNTGGQTLRISGVGFNGTDVSVLVGGVPCNVHTADSSEIICVTGASDSIAPLGYQPGQPGLSRKVVLNTTSYSSLDGADYHTLNISTVFETLNFHSHDYYAQRLSGWFTAPVDGEYRFFVSCDDYCELRLDSTTPYTDGSTTPSPSVIASRTWYTSWRNYLYDNTPWDTHKSEWITLVGGESYYIQGDHKENGGAEHFTVSVEIKPTTPDAAAISEHPKASRTIQQLALDQVNTFEEWSFTIDSPDGGEYKINFLNPTTDPFELWQSDIIYAGCSAADFSSKISGYYDSVWDSGITVTLTMYDASSLETSSAADAVTYTYTVTMTKVIDGYSTNAVVASAVTSVSSFSSVPPLQGIKSSLPVNGTFRVQCEDHEGYTYTTNDMVYNAGISWIQYQMMTTMPFLMDKIDVYYDYRNRYWENGVSFRVKFTGVNYDVPLCSLIDGIGEYPITGNDLTANNTYLQHYGETIMFEPVPLEFLRSDAQAPQVLVTIDGTQAICSNLNCDYYVVAPIEETLTQTYTSGVETLRITGSSMLQSDGDLSVKFGPVDCVITSQTDTQISCDLAQDAVAGEWIAVLNTKYGDAVTTISTPEIVLPEVNSVSPNTDINYLGGDILLITGNRFGSDASVVQVLLSDGSTCAVKSVSQTEITCEVQRMVDNSVNPTIEVVVNGVSGTSFLSLSLMSAVMDTSTLVPSSVSPVLKSEIVITLGSTFTDDLTGMANSFTVVAYSDSDPDFKLALYVMSVDVTNNSLKVKFPGAESGTYHIQVSSTQYGRFQSDMLQLDVHSTVTDIQPRQGSRYGGTLVTITGENFSDDPLDNPVKIGDSYCYVQTTSATQITCRQDFAERVAEEVLVIVFLKASEEAQCDEDLCKFTYVEPTAVVDGIETAFSEDTLTHQAYVSGSGLTDDLQLWIDGIQQELLEVTDMMAVFDIVDINAVSSSDIKFYNNAGYPEGSEFEHTINLIPSILEIYPETGNSGGTWITVRGTGFGTQTENLNLIDATRRVALCQEVDIVEYGVFNCLTEAFDIAASTNFKLSVNGVSQASYVDSAVAYTQSADITFDTAEALSGQIQFIGAGFPTSGFSAKAYFNGVEADTVTIISSSSAVASWTSTGLAAVTATPQLEFVADDLSYSMFAKPAAGLTVTQTLNVVGSTPDMSCSFAGGCIYAIEAPGLYATLLDPLNTVSFCGNPCALREDLSDSAYAICELAPLATTYSVETFQITESQVLKETIFPDGSESLHDDDHMVDYTQTSQGCEFGMTFKKGHVAVLDEAKVFINFMTDKSVYVDKLVFEGSNDGWETYEQIHTFSEEIHEGWNYIYFRDWDTKPTYSSYRFHGIAAGACRVTEFKLTGVQAIADTNTAHTCSPVISIKGVAQDLSDVTLGDVTYDDSFTPTITSISPRFGSVLGGDTVTISGSNLLGSATANVLFDNRECIVESNTDTAIVCVTSDKPYVPDSPEVRITIEGLGSVATKGLIFRYVSLWSEPSTWGFDIPPIAGDSIHIPQGQHLLVDVDSTEILQAIIVEGSLIFAPHETDPTHHRTFDCHYIMVQHGYLEVGTEANPYTSRITITMYGDKFTPTLPLFGNKVIAVHHGTIDMHGVERDVAWTRLAHTVEAGGTSITLLTETDWQVGEEIVIASTSFSNTEAETRIITGVNGATFSFAEPLLYKHISETPTYGGIEIPMQGEVGLLTRNILFRGDPVLSPVEKYGAHIMLHSEGDDSSIARIEWIEIKDGGQAFKLGKYPIHMHMIGNVHKSYVKGNAIHQTYNRAFTTHGVHYFRVINNIAFDTMGHTFFIEDAIETNNVYDGNLAIQVKKSDSLLNTDQTPGGFWITNPDNILRNNAIAGTDAYAYWYDMQTTAIGPSFDPNICPEFTKLGEFVDNTAHSTRKYGLRIFHALIPRTYPCKASPYDANYLAAGKTDPYWQNPKVPAVFENLIAWKCGRNGAITERTGHVEFKNFRVADNGIAGMEYSMIEDIAEDGRARITGGLCVGNTGLNDDDGRLANSELWGIIGPRWEYFSIEGTTFYNYDQPKSGAIGTCSHCFHPASTDSGGRTVTTTGLVFDDASVPRRVHWQFPFREIIKDLDGSLTGLGANTWATPFYPHNLQPECQASDLHEGIICDSTVQIRRVAWFGASPGSFNGLPLKVAQWDAAREAEIKGNEALRYEFEQDVNHEYFSIVEYRPKQNPMQSWPVPFVTGHKYRIHWAEGIDFEDLRLEISPTWEEDDLPVHIMTNHTDVRVAINVTDSTGELIENNTYNKHHLKWVSGVNVLYNETEVREFHFIINGREYETHKNLRFQGFRCLVNCEENYEIDEVQIESTPRYWSNPDSWTSGAVPIEDEEVEIESGWNMVMDIEPPLLKKLVINGRLSFLNEADTPHDLTLHARIIYVRAGEFLIGSEELPYNGNAQVKLYGAPTDEALAFSMVIEAGNKVLANVGKVAWYGQKRDQMSRLRKSAYAGDRTITVYPNLDWKTGDKLALLPTATQYTHTDYAEVESYDSRTGVVTLTERLRHYHWGQPGSTEDEFSGVDMRGEVIMLSRNVRFVGDDTDGWGAHMVISDNYEFDWMKQREGSLVLDSVEVYNCSQRNTWKSAVRFEQATRKPKLIKDSSIWGSLAWGLSSQFSGNIHVENTHVIMAKAVGVNVITSNNVTFERIVVGDVSKRVFGAQALIDKEACVSLCAYNGPDDCTDIKIRNSIAAGCPYAGFIQVGHDCGDSDTQDNFRGNVAHSSERVGAHIVPDKMFDHHLCYEGSHFAAYKCSEQGVAVHYTSKEIRMRDMVFIDNTHGGANIQTGGDTEKQVVSFSNSIVYGEAGSEDCPKGHPCYCADKDAFMSFGGNHGSKPFHILKPSSLPCYKVKSYGAWAIEAFVNNVTFVDYDSPQTRCGARQSIFVLNPSGSDYIPPHEFKNIQFINVADDAVAKFMDPKPEWHNVDDCVGFPCTAPSNVMFDFKNTRFSGAKTPDFKLADFQIVSDTADVSDKLDFCEFREIWNAWVCNNKEIGVLKFIGDDPDWEDRTVSPVYVMDEETGFNNKVNIMMDHMWDGFYTGQKHKSQMNTLLQSNRNYTIEYTSTPFKNMRYKLMGGTGFSKIKVHYWDAGSYHVYVNNKLIDYTEWDKNLGSASELTGYRGCGENRYVGVQNFLEFIITPGCEVTIKPRDAIMCNVRMEWTLKEFYESGGVTAFQDRVAAALGIHASRIKTVAVYKGSVVVDYAIQAEENDEESTTTLRRLAKKHDKLVLANSESVFGAPILSASTDGVVLVQDDSYAPQQNTNIDDALAQHQSQTKIQIESKTKVPPIIEERTVTVPKDEENQTAIIDATTSAVWVLGIAALIFVCCVGIGGLVLCFLRHQSARVHDRKLATQATYKVKRRGTETSESEMENNRKQFHKGDFDLDIFNHKFRKSKFNQDDMAANSEQAHKDSSSIDDSAMKPITQYASFNDLSLGTESQAIKEDRVSVIEKIE